jgi:hypothetical protein
MANRCWPQAAGCEATSLAAHLLFAGVSALSSGCGLPSTIVLDGVGTVVPPAYATSCAAGSMPQYGVTDCVPIGWHDCPPDFEPDLSGWGCIDVTPSTTCTGATRAALGARDCRPIGDCNAPFPPPEATFFVDPQHIADATHSQSISAALLAAPDGATIAIESGTYTEATLELRKKVVLVGRCAEQVIVQSDGSDGAGLVILADTGPDTVVRGLTLRDFSWGTDIGYGGQLTIQDCVFDHNREVGISAKASGRVTLENCVVRDSQPIPGNHLGLGAYVSDGARLELHDTTLDANTGAGVWVVHPPGQGPGTLVMTRSVITNQKPNIDLHGQGLYTDPGTTVSVDQSVFSGNSAYAVDIDGTQGVTLTHLVIRDTPLGAGMQVAHGATVSLSSSLVLNSSGAGVVAFHAGTQLSIQDTVIRGTQYNQTGDLGCALGASDGANIDASTTALIGNAQGVQVSISGTTLVLDHSLISDTDTNSGGENGYGIVSQLGAATSLNEVTVQHTVNVGILATQSGATVDAQGLLVLDTRFKPMDPPNGHGVFANDAVLSLQQTIVSQSAGVGVGYSAAAGLVSGSTISDNAIGALFQANTMAQDVDHLAAVQPLTVQIYNTEFLRNGVKILADTLPLPVPPTPVTSP